MSAKDVPTAAPWIPSRLNLPTLVAASKECQGCGLFRHATQTVFGEGPPHASVMMIGEQPGDREDLEGRPFVGPAGRLLDKALLEAGVDREQIYVTNAVKHFKFNERGKRRIHAKPNAIEIAACRPWLEAEAALLHPQLIVCLGATAAQALMGAAFRITQDRGRILQHPWASALLATVHPSALLRAPSADRRHAEFAEFVEDLRKIPSVVASASLSR